MPKCTNCQSEVDENESECPTCGAVFQDSIKKQNPGDGYSPRSIATNYIAIFLISAFLLFASMMTTPPGTTLPRPSMRPMYYVGYAPGVLFWIVAAIGMLKQDKKGVLISKLSVGIIVIFNIVATLGILAGPSARPLRRVLRPLDPISSLMGIISVAGGRFIYRIPFIFDLSAIVGSVLLIMIILRIHRNEHDLLRVTP